MVNGVQYYDFNIEIGPPNTPSNLKVHFFNKTKVGTLTIGDDLENQIKDFLDVGSKWGKSQVTTAIVITILCCILGLLIKGKEGVIPAGTQLTGYTVSQAEVNV